uniref:Putative lipocalin-2 5 n=1 Tax=Amblyomma cajennense TaxID=34607 RepID=A0A023FBW0_AMBCJ
MRTLFLTGVLFITADFAHSISRYYEPIFDNEADYVQRQDIYKAFNISPDFYWLFGFSYHSNHTENKSCVYFDIEDISESGMNWSSNFIKHGVRSKLCIEPPVPLKARLTYCPAEGK